MLRPAVLLYNTTYYDTYLYVRTATPAGFHNGNDSEAEAAGGRKVPCPYRYY